MAVVSVTKIRCYAPKASAHTLITTLQHLGIVELSRDPVLTPTTQTSFEVVTTHAKIETIRQFLAKYHSGDFFRTAFEGGRAHTTKTELASLYESYDLTTTLTAVTNFQEKLAAYDHTIRSCDMTLRTLQTFERLDIPLSSVGATTNTITYAIRGAERLVAGFLREIERAHSTTTAITHVSSTAILLTSLKTAQPKVEELISTSGVEIVHLPTTTKTGAALYQSTKTARAEAAAAKTALITEITAFATTHLPNLQKLSDISSWHTEAEITSQTLPVTDRLAIVTAWVPTAAIPTIEAALTEKLPASAIEILDHGDDVPPTELQNDQLITPFESVTKLYGVPDYRDLDPTPLLSVFFFVFFGLCLSDVGYGLILMALTGLVLYRYHVPTGTKQLLTLLFFGGFGAVCAGILFGGYLGIPPENIHPTLVSLQQFDPIANPLPVFYLSLALGFIQICFGIFLNLVRQIKLGDTVNGVLDNAPWLTLFGLIALAITNLAGVLPTTIGDTFASMQTYLFGATIVVLVLTQGRKQKNIFAKLFFGLLGLYSAVGYFADVLSYSRLMALGLATGALAFSINSIATFVGGDGFGIGTIAMVLVLILGHTLNLAISILGTFINSARLQFVEFFSKFSTGTGRAFVPFRKIPTHSIILPDPPNSVL